jgi:hypothetical protein
MSWIVDQEQLHITIGSTPQLIDALSQKVDLDNELQMIKAAILCGDHATLCSVTSSVFAAFLEMGMGREAANNRAEPSLLLL